MIICKLIRKFIKLSLRKHLLTNLKIILILRRLVLNSFKVSKTKRAIAKIKNWKRNNKINYSRIIEMKVKLINLDRVLK